MFGRELLEPELAGVVHLTKRVGRLRGREETRRLRKCDPSALARQQTLQGGRERALTGCRQPELVRGRGVRCAEKFLQDVTKPHANHRIWCLPCAESDKSPAVRKILLGLIGGARGSRTPDLLNAIQALSQLSYGPTRDAVSGQSASELEIGIVTSPRNPDQHAALAARRPDEGRPQLSSSSSTSPMMSVTSSSPSSCSSMTVASSMLSSSSSTSSSSPPSAASASPGFLPCASASASSSDTNSVSATSGATTSSSGAGAAAGRAAAAASGRDRGGAAASSSTVWHFGQTIGFLLRS